MHYNNNENNEKEISKINPLINSQKLQAIQIAIECCKTLSDTCPEITSPEIAHRIFLEHIENHFPELKKYPDIENLFALILFDILGYIDDI